jgi:hypothetical protein
MKKKSAQATEISYADIPTLGVAIEHNRDANVPSKRFCALAQKCYGGTATKQEQKQFEAMWHERDEYLNGEGSRFNEGARWLMSWRKAAGGLVVNSDGTGRIAIKGRYLFDPMDELRDLVDRLIKDAANESVGSQLVGMTYDLVRMFKELCDDPPKWFEKLAAVLPEVPWFVVGGKIESGFQQADKRMKFGNGILKRGKTQFDVIASKHALIGLRKIAQTRKLFEDEPWRLDSDGLGESKDFDEINPDDLRIALLPDLSQATKEEWWAEINALIKREVSFRDLPENYRKNIALSLTYRTPAAIMAEHLKRCRKAFFGMIPKE